MELYVSGYFSKFYKIDHVYTDHVESFVNSEINIFDINDSKFYIKENEEYINISKDEMLDIAKNNKILY